MLTQDFMLGLLGALADIREALWVLVASQAVLAAVVLIHAIATRRKELQ
jgi:hypothetical protein